MEYQSRRMIPILLEGRPTGGDRLYNSKLLESWTRGNSDLGRRLWSGVTSPDVHYHSFRRYSKKGRLDDLQETGKSGEGFGAVRAKHSRIPGRISLRYGVAPRLVS